MVSPENEFQVYSPAWIFTKHTGLKDSWKKDSLPPTNHGITLEQALTNVDDPFKAWDRQLKNLSTELAVSAHRKLYWADSGIEDIYAVSPVSADLLTEFLVRSNKDAVAAIIKTAITQLIYLSGIGTSDNDYNASKRLLRVIKSMGATQASSTLHKLLIAAIVPVMASGNGNALYGRELINKFIKDQTTIEHLMANLPPPQ